MLVPGEYGGIALDIDSLGAMLAGAMAAGIAVGFLFVVFTLFYGRWHR